MKNYVQRRTEFEENLIALLYSHLDFPKTEVEQMVTAFAAELSLDEFENDFIEALFEIPINTFYKVYEESETRQTDVWTAEIKEKFEACIESMLWTLVPKQ